MKYGERMPNSTRTFHPGDMLISPKFGQVDSTGRAPFPGDSVVAGSTPALLTRCCRQVLIQKGYGKKIVNWNSRLISKGSIVGSNIRITKVTEKNGVRTFEGELMLPEGFKSKLVTITAPADSQDIPISQASGA